MVVFIFRFLFNCHNPNSTSTQLKSCVWHENDFRLQPPTTTHTNSMSAISQLLLTRFQPKFKVRFLGWTTTTTITKTLTTTAWTTSHLSTTWFWPSLKVGSFHLIFGQLSKMKKVDEVIFAKLSLNSTQLNFNINFEAEPYLQIKQTPTHPTGKVVKSNKALNCRLQLFLSFI